ncbi:uncharacterized protein [Rutidosis leptorrhynchoides]|uniref:uncharacterized protein n=1 Tax=Rutidosis leptorrhynchoides TaxID=125765 RepID=UPI003A98FF3E
MEQENITDQIAEVRQLLSQLKIIEEEKETYEHKNYNIEENKEEIVYGYEDESEDDSPFRMKLEKIPESTSGHKRRREFYHDDYMNEKGYTKQNDKWKKFPDEYTPSIKTNIDILNLDCVQNKEEALTLWMNNTGLMIQLEKIFQDFNPNLVWTFVTYKVTGSVKNYLQTLDQGQIEYLLKNKTTNSDVFFTIVDAINREFLGKDDVDKKKATEAAEAEKALWHLNNIQICNMCDLESYTCEFQKYYYKLPADNRETHKDTYLNKLPWPLSKAIKDIFMSEVANNRIADTLGGVIEVTQNYIAQQCLQRSIKKQLKHPTGQLCCKNNPKVPGNYGCNKERRRKIIKKYRWRKFPKNNYKKYSYKKNNFKRRKFFKKKPPYKKEKYCPENKRTCRCWLCNEEGHYANKCPNKKKTENKEKLKILNITIDNHLEPIEDSDSEIEEIYELLSDYSSSEEEYSSSDE